MVSINTIALNTYNSRKESFFKRLWNKLRTPILTIVAGITLGPIAAGVSRILIAWLDSHNNEARTTGLNAVAVTLSLGEENLLSNWMTNQFNPTAKSLIETVDGKYVIPDFAVRYTDDLQGKIDRINDVSRLSNMIMAWAENQAQYLERGWSQNVSNARLELVTIVMDSIQKAIDEYIANNNLPALKESVYTEEFSKTPFVKDLVLSWTGEVRGTFIFLKHVPTLGLDTTGNTDTASGAGNQQTATTSNNSQQQPTTSNSNSKTLKGISIAALALIFGYAVGKSKKSSK